MFVCDFSNRSWYMWIHIDTMDYVVGVFAADGRVVVHQLPCSCERTKRQSGPCSTIIYNQRCITLLRVYIDMYMYMHTTVVQCVHTRRYTTGVSGVEKFEVRMVLFIDDYHS